MKKLKKKIMAMVAVAATITGVVSSITVVNATHVAGIGDCDAGCISEWDYNSSDAYSNYYNDAHKHLSYVTVGGNNYYSNGINGGYYVNEGSWSYASHSKSWYQSASCHYRNVNGCEPPMILV